MFEWVFSEFLERRSPYAFKSKLGVSEKTVYSWCYPNHTPHGRKDPITRAVEVLDVIFELEPSIGFDALADIANRYGYRLEKLSEEEEVALSVIHREFSEFMQEEIKAREDGRITPEEAERILKELRDVKRIITREEARLRAIANSRIRR